MNAHVISAAKCLLEFYVLDPALLLLDSLGVAQVHQLLDGGDVLVIVIGRVVAQHVHVEARALLNHRQSDASGANDGDGLACDLVAKEGEKRVP